MIVYKDSFITKIFRLFKNLFKINNEDLQYEYAYNDGFSQQKNEFLSGIRVDTEEIAKKNKILSNAEKDEEELKKLSLEDLYKLEEYYDNVIKQNEVPVDKITVTDGLFVNGEFKDGQVFSLTAEEVGEGNTQFKK